MISEIQQQGQEQDSMQGENQTQVAEQPVAETTLPIQEPTQSEAGSNQLASADNEPTVTEPAESPAFTESPAVPERAAKISGAPERAAIKESAPEISPEVFIPEFGIFDLVYLEPNRRYQGRVFRLSQDQVKTLSETFGFTAHFDHPSLRSAYIDVVKTEGHINFEIERNTKPTDLALRYSRDRWSAGDSGSRSTDALRPWLKTSYDTRFLPEKVTQVMATQLRMDPEKIGNFYVRINLKEKTAGLIAEDKFVDVFPTQPFQVFALPEGQIATIPSVELTGTSAAAPKSAEQRAVSQDAGPKYATYSKSEIDRIMKMQTENITAALSGKMSGQQRSFLEAVEAQEKTFAKITERYVTAFEEARLKLESHTKVVHEASQKELERLNAELSKELTEFRAHVNKNILPISKAIEEKVKEIQVAAAKPVSKPDNLRSLVITCTGALAAVLVACTAFLYANVGQLTAIGDINSKLSQVLEKVNK
jgi:hypothetical protein